MGNGRELSEELEIVGYRRMIARVIAGAILGIFLHFAVYYFAPVDLTQTPTYFAILAVYIWVSLVAIGLHRFNPQLLSRPKGLLILRTIFAVNATAYAAALGISCCYLMVTLKMHPYAISVVATSMAGGTVAISTFAFDFLACSLFLTGLFIPIIYTSIYLIAQAAGIAEACTLSYLFFHSLAFSTNRTERRDLKQQETITQQAVALERSNRELNSSNQMLQGTLDSIDELFLIFNRDMVCYATPTERTAERLGRDPRQKDLADIFRFEERVSKEVTAWFNLLMAGTVDFDVVAPLGPQEWFDSSTKRSYRLRYASVTDATGTAGLIVIMTDITRSLLAEKSAASAEAQSRFILSASANRSAFADFIRKLKAQLKSLKAESIPLETLRRNLHDLKGLAGVFSLPFLTEAINRFEVSLKPFANERDALPLIRTQSRDIESTLEQWQEQQFETLEKLRIFAPKEIVFPESFAGQVRLSHAKNKVDLAVFDRILSELQSKSVESQLAAYSAPLQKVATSLGKKVNFTVLSSHRPPYLLSSRFDLVFDSMIHLFNNAADHGIETPEIRARQGKQEVGSLIGAAEVIYREAKTYLTITLQDDGAGLNTTRIAAVATTRGLLRKPTSDFELAQLIFETGFSTQAKANLLSGQGVGLSALAQQVRACGGTITVYPLPIGTKFEICIPLQEGDIWFPLGQESSPR